MVILCSEVGIVEWAVIKSHKAVHQFVFSSIHFVTDGREKKQPGRSTMVRARWNYRLILSSLGSCKCNYCLRIPSAYPRLDILLEQMI